MLVDFSAFVVCLLATSPAFVAAATVEGPARNADMFEVDRHRRGGIEGPENVLFMGQEYNITFKQGQRCQRNSECRPDMKGSYCHCYTMHKSGKRCDKGRCMCEAPKFWQGDENGCRSMTIEQCNWYCDDWTGGHGICSLSKDNMGNKVDENGFITVTNIRQVWCTCARGYDWKNDNSHICTQKPVLQG